MQLPFYDMIWLLNPAMYTQYTPQVVDYTNKHHTSCIALLWM